MSWRLFAPAAFVNWCGHEQEFLPVPDVTGGYWIIPILNGDLKRAVHTGIPPRDAADLKRQTLSQLRSIQRSPTRVRAYFEHPAIQYAA